LGDESLRETQGEGEDQQLKTQYKKAIRTKCRKGKGREMESFGKRRFQRPPGGEEKSIQRNGRIFQT